LNSDEDVHTAVERRLIELVGPVGGKLHTGRSRNDQVATDLRLWTMRASDVVRAHLRDVQAALLDSAEPRLETLMPGYTHMQHAQPLTWAHWALSHFWPLERDRQRLAQARERASVLPLGSAALAGTAYPVDRAALAAALGFSRVSWNSIDGVADRDFVADFLYAGALVGVHLSRLAEQLILFSSAEFGFVTPDDAYSTGSSLMPQKRNPDTLELTRGKAGRLLGHLTGLLATLKGLPSAYDKDLQEDKEPLLDAFDTLDMLLPVMGGFLRTMRLHPDRMAAQLEPGLLATELADYLVRRAIPFRQAHELVGRAVALAESRGVALNRLSAADLAGISSAFGPDVTAQFDYQSAVNKRSAVGGVAPAAVREQLAAARALLADQT
jgi:argininosuccinate lyase